MSDKLKMLSLFTGCGGLDLGFEGNFIIHKKSYNELVNNWKITPINDSWILLPKTKFEIIFANDIRQDAQNTWTRFREKKYNKNNLKDIYHLESIVDLVKRHKMGEVIFPKNVDIVTGGFPCQDFSVAGKRKGFKSDKSHDGSKLDSNEPSIESRGQLYMWMREVIGITKPKVFIAENVKGLANLGEIKKIIEQDFRSISNNGYLVIPAQILNAADYGVPQNRERIFFIGFNKDFLTDEAKDELQRDHINDKYNPYPKQTHSKTLNLFNKYALPLVTTKDYLNDLVEPDVAEEISQQHYSKAKYLPNRQGNVEIKLDNVSPTIRAEHHGNIEFRRLSEENGGMWLDELKNGKKQRRLTVRECARLQTFPDDFEFVITDKEYRVSASNAYKLIGNAVPPLLAYHLAKRIEDNWVLYFKK